MSVFNVCLTDAKAVANVAVKRQRHILIVSELGSGIQCFMQAVADRATKQGGKVFSTPGQRLGFKTDSLSQENAAQCLASLKRGGHSKSVLLIDDNHLRTPGTSQGTGKFEAELAGLVTLAAQQGVQIVVAAQVRPVWLDLVHTRAPFTSIALHHPARGEGSINRLKRKLTTLLAVQTGRAFC